MDTGVAGVDKEAAMIELRWVLRDVSAREDITKSEAVLQYRYRFLHKNDRFNAYLPEGWHWSEWIDAPVLREGSQP